VAGGLSLGLLDRHARRHGGHDDVALVAAAVALGYRHNVSRHFGLHAGVQLLLGSVTTSGIRYEPGEQQFTDETTMREIAVVTGAFANLGRVYLGPMAQIGYRGFGKSSFFLFDGRYDLGPLGGAHPALGVQFGALFFGREQLDLNFRVQHDPLQSGSSALLTLGYHTPEQR
jgi:hypothetical protein